MACNTVLYVGNRCKVFPREGVRDSRLRQQVRAVRGRLFFVDTPPLEEPSRVEAWGTGRAAWAGTCKKSELTQ